MDGKAFEPPENIALLVGADKLRVLGGPNPDAVKFFSAILLN
jgi:hypothetical protein